jgi:hypothetical protein
MAVALLAAGEQLALDPAQHLFLAAVIVRFSRLMQQGIEVYGTVVERLMPA